MSSWIFATSISSQVRAWAMGLYALWIQLEARLVIVLCWSQVLGLGVRSAVVNDVGMCHVAVVLAVKLDWCSGCWCFREVWRQGAGLLGWGLLCDVGWGAGWWTGGLLVECSGANHQLQFCGGFLVAGTGGVDGCHWVGQSGHCCICCDFHQLFIARSGGGCCWGFGSVAGSMVDVSTGGGLGCACECCLLCGAGGRWLWLVAV